MPPHTALLLFAMMQDGAAVVGGEVWLFRKSQTDLPCYSSSEHIPKKTGSGEMSVCLVNNCLLPDEHGIVASFNVLLFNKAWESNIRE